MDNRPPHTDARHAPREQAQATVEFALVLPILLLLLFAVVQFGLAFWTFQQVSAAASEGARRAAVSRTDSDRNATIAAAARNASPNLTASSMDVTATSAWTAGAPVTVTVTYPVRVSILGRTLFDSRVRSERTSRIEQ